MSIGRHPSGTPSPERVTAPADPVVRRLTALARTFPDLDRAARIYRVILPLLRAADPGASPLSLTAAEAKARIAQGLPLLRGQGRGIDPRAARTLLTRLARALESRGDRRPKPGAAPDPNGLRATAGPIRRALEDGSLDAGQLVSHAASGERHEVAELAEDLKLDPRLLWILARNALRPALGFWRRQLEPLVEGTSWQEGSCWVCGAVPLLGELRTAAGILHLRCGLCGGDWVFPHPKCPFCSNEDARTRRHLTSAKESGTRQVEACDHCHGYLKVIAAGEPTPAEMLSVEDLASLDLDHLALANGYRRPDAPWPGRHVF